MVQPSPEVPAVIRAKALLGAGHLAFYSEDPGVARRYLEESVHLWRENGNQRYLAYTLIWLGGAAGDQGDYAVVRSSLEESIALFEMLPDEWGLAVSRLYLGANEVLRRTEPQNPEHGCSLMEQSAIRFRQLKDHWQLGGALLYLGLVAQEARDNTTAQERLEEALAIFRQVGDKWRIALALGLLGNATRDAGNFGRAARLYHECLALNRELGNPQAHVLSNLGYISLAQSDFKEAAEFFVESLQTAIERNQKVIVPTVLIGLASVAVAYDKIERATRLLATAAAKTNSELGRWEQNIFDRTLAAVRVQLDETAFKVAWSEGGAMTMEQAIEYALVQVTH